jgi:hypothetical protein
VQEFADKLCVSQQEVADLRAAARAAGAGAAE